MKPQTDLTLAWPMRQLFVQLRVERGLRIHGLIYNLHDGLLKDLGLTLSKITHLPE